MFVHAVTGSNVFFPFSVRIVNAPQRKLKKGPAYHVDMLALAICTFACSITAMPLMCAGTVQSLAHVQALSRVEQVDGKERVVSVVENRLSAFLIHLLIASSVLLLPIVEKIPYTVLLGLFLFLGVRFPKTASHQLILTLTLLFRCKCWTTTNFYVASLTCLSWNQTNTPMTLQCVKPQLDRYTHLLFYNSHVYPFYGYSS